MAPKSNKVQSNSKWNSLHFPPTIQRYENPKNVLLV